MAQNVAFNETISKEQVTNSVNENVNEVNENVNNVTYQNVIKKLIASGCKRINSVRIKNVNFTEKDNYTMISFTIDTTIRGLITKNGGISYKEGQTNTVFTSLYAVICALKEDEELGWMANALLENPRALNLIFNGSTVDILQQEIPAGEEFKNPFSTREDIKSQVYDHNLIINHIIGFKLSKVGMKMADRFADKLMGF